MPVYRVTLTTDDEREYHWMITTGIARVIELLTDKIQDGNKPEGITVEEWFSETTSQVVTAEYFLTRHNEQE